MPTDPVDRMERIVSSDAVEHVFVEFPDIDGVSRSKQITAEYFLNRWREGFSMNMLLLASSTLTDIAEESMYGEEISYADGLVHPDPHTIHRTPWRDNAAIVLCDFEYDGAPAGGYSRHVLQRVLNRVPADLSFGIGSELEFLLLTETPDGFVPFTDNEHECVTWATDKTGSFYDALCRWATAIEIPIQSLQHEYGSGQYEILFDHSAPFIQADRAYRFKNLVDRAARAADIRSTFMAKPFTDESANGYHLHVSAFDGSENVFESESGDVSREGRHFIGGILEHIDSLIALQCPTLNAVKRFTRHSFSPDTASWGYNNRTSTVRIPQNGAFRIENRLGSSNANPYLLIASTLAAGIHGMSEQIEPGDPVAGDATKKRPALPRSPEMALSAVESNQVLTDWLGEDFIEVYTAVKRAELDDFYSHVTDWEKRYLAHL